MESSSSFLTQKSLPSSLKAVTQRATLVGDRDHLNAKGINFNQAGDGTSGSRKLEAGPGLRVGFGLSLDFVFGRDQSIKNYRVAGIVQVHLIDLLRTPFATNIVMSLSIVQGGYRPQ